MLFGDSIISNTLNGAWYYVDTQMAFEWIIHVQLLALRVKHAVGIQKVLAISIFITIIIITVLTLSTSLRISVPIAQIRS